MCSSDLDGYAVVVSEEEGFAATDFSPVQQPYPPGIIMCKSAGDGAVQTIRRDVDFTGKRHFLSRLRCAVAKAVPVGFVALLGGVPQVEAGRVSDGYDKVAAGTAHAVINAIGQGGAQVGAVAVGQCGVP